MSRENVEMLQGVYEAWERGDWSDSSWAAEDVEFVIADGPEPMSFSGREAMAKGWRDFLTAWADYGVQAKEYRELPDERVLVTLRAVGRGRTSGVELGRGMETGANVFDIRDGRVSRLAIYFDRERALDDLGLER